MYSSDIHLRDVVFGEGSHGRSVFILYFVYLTEKYTDIECAKNVA